MYQSQDILRSRNDFVINKEITNTCLCTCAKIIPFLSLNQTITNSNYFSYTFYHQKRYSWNDITKTLTVGDCKN